ncbi:MAG: hypothetical protein JWN68_405 [Nocardioides sp.]|jgi:hypothetical protein|uniref:hypothetical protein n=1 Tax=Nocardioides sp. TaxID=35761 RepID=UPI00262BA7BA|nr:hypothetical protein [Nocardioides sp.]MCW2832452.1 hypothetical protein [Nocardioides sp.]
MTTRLWAEYGAMTRAAADQRHARNTLIRIQHDRRAAGLDPDALGKILPAHELVATFRHVDRATRAGLWDAAQRCEDLSDGVREVRTLYRAIDEAVAERFAALRGEVR